MLCSAMKNWSFLHYDSGMGVFALRDIMKGDFILQYKGNILFDEPNTPDTYVFEFTYKGKRAW